MLVASASSGAAQVVNIMPQQREDTFMERLRARDVEKDESLKGCRVVYDFEKWSQHRSSSRTPRHMLGLLTSRVASGVRTPVLLVGVEAALLCAWEEAIKLGYLPVDTIHIPSAAPIVFNLSTFALSLLLVFRTNTSYGRFDESRKLWGSLVNRSRDIMRQASTFIPTQQEQLLHTFARWQAALPWALKNHLREEKSLREDLQGLLQPKELEALVVNAHPPNMCCHVLSSICERADMTYDQRIRMDANITSYSDVIGACERLLRTPIPVSYTRHTSRFLMTWCFLLPFVLYEPCGAIATVPGCMLLSFFLLAIEEIGVSIEEAFYILPLEAIATTISTNVGQHVRQERPVRDMVANYPGPAAAPPMDSTDEEFQRVAAARRQQQQEINVAAWP